LIAGIAVAIKTLRPRIKVVGVESTHTASFAAALAAGRPVRVRPQATLADGLAITEVGTHAFALAAPRIDQMVRVPEDLIAQAIVRTLELEKSVVEGAAAATLAALMLHGERARSVLRLFRGKRVALVFAGGNIDPLVLSRVIEKGLVADGRRFRFGAFISDRPGGLARLTQLIAESGASITDIAHDRAFSGADVSRVQTVCTVETRDRAHIRALMRKLRAAGVPVSRLD
jgi:threonine dehydratase